MGVGAGRGGAGGPAGVGRGGAAAVARGQEAGAATGNPPRRNPGGCRGPGRRTEVPPTGYPPTRSRRLTLNFSRKVQSKSKMGFGYYLPLVFFKDPFGKLWAGLTDELAELQVVGSIRGLY